jgi:hypothetical protein
MTDKEEKVEDRLVEDYDRDKRLNKEESSQNPDTVEITNRRADTKRERYVKANFDESVTEGETERKSGPQ